MKKFILGFLLGAILMCAIPTLAANNTVQALFNGVKVAVNGENITFANGEEPAMINDRTYVPAKYVAEALGATVKWDGKSNTVNIIDSASKPATDTSANTSDEKPIIPTTSKDDKHPNTNFDFHVNLYGKTYTYNENTSDGLHIYTYKNNPQKFVLSNDLAKYHSIKIARLDKLDSKYIYSMSRVADKKVLIPEVEYVNINDYQYFTLDYYENTMLPIIKAEEK
jgi:hypothetical protein